MVKFIDLSITISNDVSGDPPLTTPKVEYSDHDKGTHDMTMFFSKLKAEDLPVGKGWATETVTLSTHSGSHMDSPWHFAPIQDRETGERPAQTIDEFPLEWGIGPLIVLDCTEFEDGYVLTPEDIDKKLDDINHELQEGDIVCIHTNAAKYFGTSEYTMHGAGVGKEGTLHMVRQGVHVVGTDAWSWDAPFLLTAQKWKKSLKENKPNPSIIWEGHFAGIELGYYQMEKLTNLDKVPPVGATIYCFPVKIAKASAGWIRPVAQVSD